mgnify:CR=1 FL=1
MPTKITISILKESQKILDELKIHPREPYWEVIKRVLEKSPKKMWKI